MSYQKHYKSNKKCTLKQILKIKDAHEKQEKFDEYIKKCGMIQSVLYNDKRYDKPIKKKSVIVENPSSPLKKRVKKKRVIKYVKKRKINNTTISSVDPNKLSDHNKFEDIINSADHNNKDDSINFEDINRLEEDNNNQDTYDFKEGILNLIKNLEKQIMSQRITKLGIIIKYFLKRKPDILKTGAELKQECGISTIGHYVTWHRKYGQYEILKKGQTRGSYYFNPKVRKAIEFLTKDLLSL
jgi:hypothetical protein